MDEAGTWHGGLSPGDFMLDGDPARLPDFRPISIVSKRPDASRCHLVWMWASAQATYVLDRDPVPSSKKGGGASSPKFRPMSIVAKRLDGSRFHLVWRYASAPRPTRHCVRCGPSYPQKKGHTHLTQFLAHVYCGHGRPSQLLLSPCSFYVYIPLFLRIRVCTYFAFEK